MSTSAPALNKEYWDSRWQNNETRWDIGYAAPAIRAYMETRNRDAAILIPGCGNAYEAEMLLELGFHHITLVDISPVAVERLAVKFTNTINCVCADFFEHNGHYEIILEQTFFCALDPSLRKKYVEKMHALLNPGGILAGLLFANEFPNPGPPFGGTAQEYRQLFQPGFKIQHLEVCYNSIPQRTGNELFIECIRK
ncbi:methyltransferase domain-containing protein [Niabella soli]|uniref:SAM-dependent methlyltransferase n=1 Tax=Niabella soli DSM 19437 TaxID=929713 RepID=W0F1P8_9BACT|nr:methyltransferase domain-containing protein [Niabella soli]AHF16937.1 SAM-dependent methlyltransferase [Niabella soli DSM 19437]